MAPRTSKAPRSRKAGGSAVDALAAAAAQAGGKPADEKSEAPAGAHPAAVPEAGAGDGPFASAGPSGSVDPGAASAGMPDGNDSTKAQGDERYVLSIMDTASRYAWLPVVDGAIPAAGGDYKPLPVKADGSVDWEAVAASMPSRRSETKAAKGAGGSEDASAGRPPSGWLVRIRSQREGFRRAGIAHPKAATDHSAERFDEQQIRALLKEPVLTIVLVQPDGTEIEPPAELTE